MWCLFVQNSVLYDCENMCWKSLGFFDYQYLWKQRSLFFLHGYNHQPKKGSKTVSFGCVWPVLPLVQSDYRIPWSSISMQRFKWYHSLLNGDDLQQKERSETTTFGWVISVLPLIILEGSLIIKFSVRNQVIS